MNENHLPLIARVEGSQRTWVGRGRWWAIGRGLGTLGVLVVGMGCLALPAWANGFRVASQDGAASARGEAFVATADNASALYYNPAGITQLEGQSARLGVYALHTEVTYNGSYKNTKDWHVLPHFYYTYNPESLPLAFGLGVYMPYGLSSEWPQDTGFRTIAIEGELRYWTVNPVVAWEIIPTLSIAAGATINQSSLDISQGVLLPVPGDSLSFDGEDTMAGFNAGLLWKIHPKVQFGASYRSATQARYNGTVQAYGVLPPPLLTPYGYEQSGQASLSFPQNVVGGISFRPTPKWNLEFNVDWTDWGELEALTIQQQAAVPPLFPQEIGIPLQWESSFYYEFGVTYRISDAWTVSGGYIYNENSVPDETYNPLVADLDRQFITVGATYRLKQFEVSAAYQFGFAPVRTVSGSTPSVTGQTVDGTYEFQSHALVVTLGANF